MDNVFTGPLLAAAALDEMKFWVPIMMEHSKFIRGGLNPSLRNEELFRTADRFAVEFSKLMSAVNSAVASDVTTVNALMDQTIRLTIALRNFKVRMFNLISACQVTTELPAPLLDHIRREADFFLTVLNRIQGKPGASDQVLGISDGQLPANIVARALIPHTGPALLKVARDENLFHLRIQHEHGEVLLLIAYRPKLQEVLYNETGKFAKKLERLHKEAQRIPLSPAAYVEFNNKVRLVMVQWHNFLRTLHHEVVTCQVPGEQINAPALILDHMAREVTYYISVIDIVNQALCK